MKKLLVFALVLAVLAVVMFGEISIGGGVAREIGGLNRTMLEGRVTFGNSISSDIVAQFFMGNSASQLQFYTYINWEAIISYFQIYVGFSPNWFISSDGFSSEALLTNGYAHLGIGFECKFMRMYGEIVEPIVYIPLSFGMVPTADVGIQYRF
ncbi:hypothetical protein [Mesoaciditoga lauensis]|uniref:hypothetical protein n=1 Tax=Mesoaciditoga lauensis TaxID=1495039 RepID=UPI00055D1547|nr:hypothetical protein [Mesoaciditoga lauensis]